MKKDMVMMMVVVVVVVQRRAWDQPRSSVGAFEQGLEVPLHKRAR